MKRRAFLQNAFGAASVVNLRIPGQVALGGALGSMLVPAQLDAETPRGTDHPLWPLWMAWRTTHLDVSGRVIDGPQRSASHSEGQGYGMVLAAFFGDRSAFERMGDWTEINLAIRPDNLLAWRWLPDLPERVPDLNNASDGDLFYAWALLMGSTRFGNPQWRTRAIGIANDLVSRCVAMRPDRPDTPMLLPAVEGFTFPQRFIFNPSYIMPRALRALAEASGQQVLSDLARSGVGLITELSARGLTPDWVQITSEGVSAAPGFSPHAGYESIRVPLFLAWSGEQANPAVARAAAAMARAPVGMTAVVKNVTTGQSLEYSSDPGYGAIAALTRCIAEGQLGASIPPFSSTQPYYPATLHLFTLLAQTERFPQCHPI